MGVQFRVNGTFKTTGYRSYTLIRGAGPDTADNQATDCFIVSRGAGGVAGTGITEQLISITSAGRVSMVATGNFAPDLLTNSYFLQISGGCDLGAFDITELRARFISGTARP